LNNMNRLRFVQLWGQIQWKWRLYWLLLLMLYWLYGVVAHFVTTQPWHMIEEHHSRS